MFVCVCEKAGNFSSTKFPLHHYIIDFFCVLQAQSVLQPVCLRLTSSLHLISYPRLYVHSLYLSNMSKGMHCTKT